MLDEQFEEAKALLIKLIKTSSFSKEEEYTAEILASWFSSNGILYQREKNNLWAFNKHFQSEKPTILLNSHHDTVKVNNGWTRDPFGAEIQEGKLYGLGSNDAGAALVCLMHAFLWYYDVEGKYNLCIACTAEEEISGKNGIASILPNLGEIGCAIVGEPTEMKLATSEKGLMVLDCSIKGKSGHAARNEGENAIYKAIPIINSIKTLQFPKESEVLGPAKLTVTKICAGDQHNVVPDLCEFVIDVRTTDAMDNKEVLEYLQQKYQDVEFRPRSTRLNPSYLPKSSPIYQASQSLNLQTFGSPTLSDQALISAPSCKIGPGKSARSHTPDEFIELEEINQGLIIYKQLLGQVL
jgi:acetylornithine deacetylase